MVRNRCVFISDIHMGTAQSIEGDHPYGWLRKDRADLLANFLSDLMTDDSLLELVIGGDLFDEWVEPYTTVPPSFQAIADAPQNKAIISALKKLAVMEGVTVTYVPGNHDMLMESDELQKIIPKIKPVITGQGRGIYRSGRTVVEHGSLYTLFNAPDSYDNPGYILPLGFFVARSQAEGATTGHPVTKAQYKDVVINVFKKLVTGESFSSAVFESVVKEIESPTGSILMDGLGHYQGKITVDQVSEIFKNLYHEWDDKMPGNVPATIAVIGEAAILYPAALKEYGIPFFEKKQSADIVVFGHTHEWEIKGMEFSMRTVPLLIVELAKVVEELIKGDIKKAMSIIEDLADPGPNKASDFIYVNTGTWIDGDSGISGEPPPPATYAVIEESDSQTTVKVYEYTGKGSYLKNTPLGSRYTSS